MDSKLEHLSNDPSKLRYSLIKEMTNDFQEELGRGSFGTVFKGINEYGEEIAVKVLHPNILDGLDDTKFKKELDNLRGLEHQNIVKLVGFCNETVDEPSVFNGKDVIAARVHRALCFEYASNGSLSTLISDQDTGLDWDKRFTIIIGVCNGLKYLFEGLKQPITHLDLKPENILLSKNMVAKIADFGISTLVGEENTKKAMMDLGTRGYCPPEYVKHQIISKEFDIFSLGVIIVNIMVGKEGYFSIVGMTRRKSVKLVHDTWRNRLRKSSTTSLDESCNQVKTCIMIALDCLKSNRQERPTIQTIVSSLSKIEVTIGDQGTRNEQSHKDDGESTLCSEMSNLNIQSKRSSGPSVQGCSDATMGIYIKPKDISLQLLIQMTNGFSEERLLGKGRYGSVYKGNYQNGQTIVVKLNAFRGIDDTVFENEMAALMRVRHPNVVQLVGYYCGEEEQGPWRNGVHILDIDMRRAMVFEYSQHGSLDEHISDPSCGLDWHTRYQIIRGICEGLRYLHEGLKSPIIHMNLKPSNILLDKDMMPKIGDFGMQKITGEENFQSITSNTETYGVCLPQELMQKQDISIEFDIYSLGFIIIKMLTAVERSNSEPLDLFSGKFIELILEKWRERLQKMLNNISVEGYCQQVKKCLEIALKCVESDRHKRPAIGDIVYALNETETLIHHPLELRFPLMPSEPRKNAMISSCSLQLNNKDNDHIAFRLVASNPKRYFPKKPLFGVVPPRCVYTLGLTMTKHPSSPLDSGDFFTLRSTAVGEYDVDKDPASIKYELLFKNAKENTVAGEEEVREVTLKAFCDGPAEPKENTIIIMPDAKQVSSIDVHPIEPWIMTTNNVGSLRVWDYNTMTTLDSFEFAIYEPVCAAKFIAQKKLLVAGACNGVIHVYSYGKKEHIESFDAHDTCVTTLAVHPTRPSILLSSSEDDDHLIKLWDWDDGWKCTRMFEGHTDKVTQVMFNPEDNNSFASVSSDRTVKIWSIFSNDPNDIITLDGNVGGLLCVDYFKRRERQHLIVGSEDKTPQIWKLGVNICCDMLEGHDGHISVVQLHPKHRLLITGSLDGTVRIWDSTTYKLMNIIGFNLGAVYSFGCIKDSKRIVVGCHQGIAVMEFSLP